MDNTYIINMQYACISYHGYIKLQLQFEARNVEDSRWNRCHLTIENNWQAAQLHELPGNPPDETNMASRGIHLPMENEGFDIFQNWSMKAFDGEINYPSAQVKYGHVKSCFAVRRPFFFPPSSDDVSQPVDPMVDPRVFLPMKVGSFWRAKNVHLVGGPGKNPSEKYDFVNWDDESNPILMGKCQIDEPNHQPVMFNPLDLRSACGILVFSIGIYWRSKLSFACGIPRIIQSWPETAVCWMPWWPFCNA